MLCRNPYVKAGQAFPCGQCMPCRFNKRREWSHRIMLEASLREDNCWLTLTYSDENIPVNGDGLEELRPKDLQDWLKRMRRAYAPLRFRFYAVGEYGDDTWRPHYHVCLFGFPTCRFGRSRFRERRSSCCASCDMVLSTWGKGLVELGILSVESAQYTAGYVTKKMTSERDLRLDGRHPEFSRMSLRPGIGADMMHEVASSVLQYGLDKEDDVPGALRHGRRILPLGRYLRRKLRTLVGRSANAPQATLDFASAEVRPVQASEWDNPENSPVPFGKRVKAKLSGLHDVQVLQMATRQRIRKKRSVI